MAPGSLKLLALVLAFSSAIESHSEVNKSVELEFYIQQNMFVVKLLVSEGCMVQQRHSGVQRTLDSIDVQLDVQKRFYSELIEQLSRCRSKATTTTTSATPTSTTTIPQPPQCLSAINLTESWRKDHSDSGIRPIDGDPNCDTIDMNVDRFWFRFSGAAGNRLLDHCVPSVVKIGGGSCGTSLALWSDDTMPDQIGVVTSILAYPSFMGSCKHSSYTAQCQVIRCSDKPHDFVYRLVDDVSPGCYIGFCGMD